MADPQDILRRQLSSSSWSDGYEERSSHKGKNHSGRKFTTTGSTKPKGPVASLRSSELAQRWYDLGEREGFSFPFNVNYFALALQRKIERDKEILPFLEAGKHDQVQRWVRKMIDLWWSPLTEHGSGGYLTNEINQRNAKDFFLDTDWDDLRDYARTCLRAAYLKDHHRVAPKPVYPDQIAYRERLEEIEKRGKVNRWLRSTEDEAEHDPIDPKARERLRSWVNRKKEERRGEGR